ncbi:SNF7 family protein [Actinidia rufa]|uniref:SNF7 family protein n=1 Tax=Actinidia rufa TaxID=165716 RepID=A0A7J0G5P0_9ERIC|nr:SNF7 family protein [Actinidia rufa]
MEEKKLVAEIKKTAKTGNEANSEKFSCFGFLVVSWSMVTVTFRIAFEAATRILARQLVRLRQQITNLQGSRAQIRGVATHTQALYANTSISTGMKGATKAMVAMNKKMAPAKQAKVIREFQKQSAQMDMTIEMMSESIDETLDKDEAEEETEELTNQVLDEIGVDIASQVCFYEIHHATSISWHSFLSYFQQCKRVSDPICPFVTVIFSPKGRIGSKKVETVVPRQSKAVHRGEANRGALLGKLPSLPPAHMFLDPAEETTQWLSKSCLLDLSWTTLDQGVPWCSSVESIAVRIGLRANTYPCVLGGLDCYILLWGWLEI